MTREEAWNRIDAIITKNEVDDEYVTITNGKDYDALRYARKVLEQEPKTGHWIGHREHCENLGVIPSGLGAYEWCSNCDCGIDVRECHRNNYNYCPNCGARMVEPQETQESDHKCHTCKHYTSGERDGSCGSYICKEYSNWESEDNK